MGRGVTTAPMKKEQTGLIYDIQGFSVHDGPGIRTTVFLKGCPLRCPWCHSPESQSFEKQLSFMDMKCVGVDRCGSCLNVCPASAIGLGRVEWSEIKKENVQHIQVDDSRCTECFQCTGCCFPGALSVCGEEYTVDGVLERVLKDLNYYQHSGGGGVTISGGEPLSQYDFTLRLLKALKEHGVNTALDTTGYASTRRILDTLPYVDTYLYDLKHMDSRRHREVIGVPNEIILENARQLAQAGGHFQIRMPVIPGFNDSDENFRAFGEFCVSLGSAVDVVQLLPFHRFGDVKYERLQRKSPMPESVMPPGEAEVKARVRELKKLGLHVTVH